MCKTARSSKSLIRIMNLQHHMSTLFSKHTDFNPQYHLCYLFLFALQVQQNAIQMLLWWLLSFVKLEFVQSLIFIIIYCIKYLQNFKMQKNNNNMKTKKKATLECRYAKHFSFRCAMQCFAAKLNEIVKKEKIII